MRKLILMAGLLPVFVSANPRMPGDFPPHGEFGKPPMHHPMPEDADRLPPFLQELGLSEQQQSEIKSLLKAHMNLMGETRKNDHAIKMQLHQLSYSGAYSEQQATALIEQVLAAHRTQALQQAQLDNAIYKVLTAEQQAVVQAKISKMSADKPF